ncbi:MAG: hypothetical protein ACREGE_01125 [Candidatus Microsaccharimonas sp.]
MDSKHRLDAPNNDTLKDIEQIGDRSESAAVYPHAKNDWDGVDLLSGEARMKKQEADRLRVNLTIRRWFPIIGFLIPVPAVALAAMAALAMDYLDPKMAIYLLLPVFFGVFVWGFLSYHSIKAVRTIFYNHSIKLLPYLIAHVGFLLVAFRGLFMYAQTFHNGWAIGDVLMVGAIVFLASMILSGILLFIWTTRRIASNWKLLLLLILTVAIAGIQLAYELL